MSKDSNKYKIELSEIKDINDYITNVIYSCKKGFIKMTYYGDYDDYDDRDYEAEEEKRIDAAKARLRAMTPEQLGKEYQRECRRHDSAVDRCEQLNSPTIEDAQGWMNFIEGIFKERGLNYFDYIFDDDKEE